jgi:hypothetical protein
LIVHDLSAVKIKAAPTSRAVTSADENRFDALLSFTPFTSRTPVVDFLTHSISGLPRRERAAAKQMLLRRFRHTLDPQLPHGFDAYNPRRAAAPGRLAAYSANLLTLIVCTTGGIAADELYGDHVDDAIRHWNSHKLLWRSQLPPGWQSPADVYGLHPLPDDNAGSVRLYINRDTPEASGVEPRQ